MDSGAAVSLRGRLTIMTTYKCSPMALIVVIYWFSVISLSSFKWSGNGIAWFTCWSLTSTLVCISISLPWYLLLKLVLALYCFHGFTFVLRVDLRLLFLINCFFISNSNIYFILSCGIAFFIMWHKNLWNISRYHPSSSGYKVIT